jgi:hypothetical protein
MAGTLASLGWHITELRAERPRTCDPTARRAKRISPPRRPDQPSRPPDLLGTGYREEGDFPRVKWPGRGPDPMSNTYEVKGRSGDRIPVRARFSAPVQTGPGAHPAS